MNTSDWIQFSLVIITLWALIWEMRQRRKSTGYSTYLEVSKTFIESSMALIDKPSLRSIYFFDDKYKNSSDEEREISAYCDSLIMMFENVWDCYDRGFFRTSLFKGFKKDDGTWFDHYRWFELLVLKSEPFQKAWDISRDEYYSEFKAVGNILLDHIDFFNFLNNVSDKSTIAKQLDIWELKSLITNLKFKFRKFRINKLLKKINDKEIINEFNKVSYSILNYHS